MGPDEFVPAKAATPVQIGNAPCGAGLVEQTIMIDPLVRTAILDRVAEAGCSGIGLGFVAYLDEASTEPVL